MVFPGWYTGGSSGGGVTDHGNLDGLTDDFRPCTSLESEDHTHESTGLQGGQLPAGVSAMEHVSSVTLSDDAVADFVLDNAKYKSYLFVLENVVPVSDNVDFWVRTDSDGGVSFDAGANDYDWVWQRAAVGVGTFFAESDTADSEITFRSGWGSDAGESGSGIIAVYGPANVAHTLVNAHLSVVTAAGGYQDIIGSGRRAATADVDAIRFLFSSGNLESGEIHMYGLKA